MRWLNSLVICEVVIWYLKKSDVIFMVMFIFSQLTFFYFSILILLMIKCLVVVDKMFGTYFVDDKMFGC